MIETVGAATVQSAGVVRCGASPKCESHEDPIYEGRVRPGTREDEITSEASATYVGYRWCLAGPRPTGEGRRIHPHPETETNCAKSAKNTSHRTREVHAIKRIPPPVVAAVAVPVSNLSETPYKCIRRESTTIDYRPCRSVSVAFQIEVRSARKAFWAPAWRPTSDQPP